MVTYTTLASDFLKQFYSYRRPFQEVEGYFVRGNEDGSSTVFINALGVDPKDVSVEVRSEYPNTQILSVTGKTKDDVWDEEFSVNVSLYVRKPIRKVIKTFRAGLITLKVEYDNPTQPNVEIVEG